MTVRDTLFLRALRREPVERTPIWLMRQAGRVLPEYRAVRARWSLIEICRQPELCAEVSLQPIRRFGVDALVLFADIMLPLIGSGVAIELVDDVGPVIRDPVRDAAGIAALRPLEPEADVGFVLETIGVLRRELGDRLPVIGFSGAPFTLAAYLVEGRPSRDFAQTKAMMFGEPALWHALMERLTNLVIAYLRAQVSAGVQALQLFDSWVGCLSPDQYERFVRPYTQRIFHALDGLDVPRIHFGTGASTLLEQMRDDGADAISVDWRLPLDEAWARIGHHRAIQGNLDPAILYAPPGVIADAANDVLRRAGGRPGHVFNLGHGVLPGTPLEHVQRLVDVVQNRTIASAPNAAQSAPSVAAASVA
jgi:uroporphyrinogen decarboxylase